MAMAARVTPQPGQEAPAFLREYPHIAGALVSSAGVTKLFGGFTAVAWFCLIHPAWWQNRRNARSRIAHRVFHFLAFGDETIAVVVHDLPLTFEARELSLTNRAICLGVGERLLGKSLFSLRQLSSCDLR
jgi:hypothetical protein